MKYIASKNKVFIQDENLKTYFAFVSDFPAVCAQGKSIPEVEEKIDNYFKKFLDKIKN